MPSTPWTSSNVLCTLTPAECALSTVICAILCNVTSFMRWIFTVLFFPGFVVISVLQVLIVSLWLLDYCNNYYRFIQWSAISRVYTLWFSSVITLLHVHDILKLVCCMSACLLVLYDCIILYYICLCIKFTYLFIAYYYYYYNCYSFVLTVHNIAFWLQYNYSK